MDKSITKRQRDLLDIIYRSINSSGYPPTFEEMRESLSVSSNQSVVDLLTKLEEKAFIKRSEATARSIAILPLGYEVLGKPALAPFLGVTTAGIPLEPVEISGEWQQVSADTEILKDNVSLLRIKGDSMINAGLNDGDIILVKSQKEFTSGTIVLADVRGEYTIKRFMSVNSPPYLYLKPENPHYDIIYFTEDVELKGRVISVLKEGQWQLIS